MKSTIIITIILFFISSKSVAQISDSAKCEKYIKTYSSNLYGKIYTNTMLYDVLETQKKFKTQWDYYEAARMYECLIPDTGFYYLMNLKVLKVDSFFCYVNFRLEKSSKGMYRYPKYIAFWRLKDTIFKSSLSGIIALEKPLNQMYFVNGDVIKNPNFFSTFYNKNNDTLDFLKVYYSFYEPIKIFRINQNQYKVILKNGKEFTSFLTFIPKDNYKDVTIEIVEIY